jgi:hypothetical protein
MLIPYNASSDEGVGRCMWHVWRRGEVLTGFWWGSMRGRDQLEDTDADGRIILKWIFKKEDWG